jgi:hypothetical protein
VLDFTIGDEPYKRLFGAKPLSMWMVSRAGSPLGSLAGLVVEHAPWIKNVAKRLVQKRPVASARSLGSDVTAVEASSVNRT